MRAEGGRDHPPICLGHPRFSTESPASWQMVGHLRIWSQIVALQEPVLLLSQGRPQSGQLWPRGWITLNFKNINFRTCAFLLRNSSSLFQKWHHGSGLLSNLLCPGGKPLPSHVACLSGWPGLETDGLQRHCECAEQPAPRTTTASI